MWGGIERILCMLRRSVEVLVDARFDIKRYRQALLAVQADVPALRVGALKVRHDRWK